MICGYVKRFGYCAVLYLAPRGAPSNKLHIKLFIVLILYCMAFTHFNSSRFFDNTCSLQSHQRQCPQKCFNHFCVTTILGSANKEEPCVSVARKECWPYACESPWRRMLFNMPSSTTRGRRSKHIPPSDLVYVSIW